MYIFQADSVFNLVFTFILVLMVNAFRNCLHLRGCAVAKNTSDNAFRNCLHLRGCALAKNTSDIVFEGWGPLDVGYLLQNKL